MTFRIKTLVLAAAITTCLGAFSSAEAGNNGWAWAKPLNKKAGHAFYTGNRNINNSYAFRSRNWRQTYGTTSHHYRAPTTRYSVVPRTIVTTPRVITKAPVVIQSKPTVLTTRPRTSTIYHGTVIQGGKILHGPVVPSGTIIHHGTVIRP
ncbi:MAG: hypothetical protein AAFX06_32300 [Planctomycetota bacterium]